MKGHGGFEHNQHSLRIVEELEQKYPNFPGLNLSWEVREGLAKHHTAYDHPGGRKGFDAKNSSLEAQIANLADEITYYSHDLDDGLDSGLLSEKNLIRNVRVWAHAAQLVKKEFGNLPDECRRYFTIRTIIDMQIHDVVENSERLIQKAGVQSADDVRLFARPLIALQSRTPRTELGTAQLSLQKFVLQPRRPPAEPARGENCSSELFNYYLKHPKEIGESSRRRLNKIGLHRAVCDYIAGMTDRYVMLEYQRIFGQHA